MAEVTVKVNGRPYPVGCEDGQEAHVASLAEMFDVHVRQVAAEVGQLGETRLFLLGALLLADELAEAKSALSGATADLRRAHEEHHRLEARAVKALETAAKKVETLAAKAAV